MIQIGKVRSSDTRLFLDYHDISGDMNAGSQTFDQPAYDVRCFSDPGPAMLVDYYQTRDEWNGFFSRSVGAVVIDKILNDLVGSEADHYLLKLFMGNAENQVAYEMISRLGTNPISSRVGQAVVTSFTADGAGACYRGTVLRSATVTGTGTGTGRNLGITTTDDIFAVTYRVISGTFTSITLQTQQSSDNGAGDAYVDIAGLNHTFTARGALRVTTSAATEAWKRTRISAFVGTNALILVTAGKVTQFVG